MRTTTIAALAGAICLTLTACGGGGGGGASNGGGATAPAALTLGAITPASGSTTGTDTVPFISLSATPDMSSATASSVALTNSAGAVKHA